MSALGVSRTRGQAGMTLVELMISMAVASLAIASSMGVAAMVSNQYKDSRDVSQVERSARMSLELIADSVRSAGPGVKSGLIADAIACSEINAIRVTNNVTTYTLYSPTYGAMTATPGTDVLEVIHASGGVYATARADVASSDGSITVTSTAGFRRGDLALIIDLAGAAHLVAIPPGAGPLPPGQLPITSTGTCGVPAAATYAAGALVVRARASRFFVTTLPGESFPSLMLDMDADGPLEPEPVEPGIEDLQVAIAIDDNNDDSIDSVSAPQLDEWHGNSAADVPHTAVADDVTTGLPSWRALRVTLSSRSLDGSGNPQIYTRPAIEDHAAGSLDQVRHRVLTTIIELRNLEGSQ